MVGGHGVNRSELGPFEPHKKQMLSKAGGLFNKNSSQHIHKTSLCKINNI